ncbi:MAG TPA: hypothetical protein VLC71_08385 [Thermomonas sp.]|nr:hypothetical protein [Thermomonas sp.]
MLGLLIAATLQVSAGSNTEFPVAFTQDDMQWPVVVSANGVVSAGKDSLVVKLRGVEVADQPANPNTIPYSSYRICLVRAAADAPYETAGCSEPVKLRPMAPESDGTVSLPSQKLTIPASAAGSLEGYWLVLEMLSRPVQGRSHNVASHSQRSLFGAVGSR